MKQYYINVDNKQIGPLSFDELKENKITRETIVWFEGLQDWQKAGDIEELKLVFKNFPPPINQSNPPPILNFEKSSPLKESGIDAESKILGLKKNVFYIVISVVVVLSTSFYFTTVEQSSEIKLLEQNRQTEIHNELLEQQQKEIEEQNIRIAEQELLNKKRVDEENRIAKEKQINELLDQLNISYANLREAKKQLNDASSFRLLRSSSERNNDISSAEENVSIWEHEIEELEKKIKKLNPKWGQQ